MELSIYDFFDVLRQLFSHTPWNAHLKLTCRRLRLIAIWKDEPQEDAGPVQANGSFVLPYNRSSAGPLTYEGLSSSEEEEQEN